MKILFFIDKVNNKIIHMSNDGRLALADPITDAHNMSYVLHGLNKERSSKYLHKLKNGEYASFLEPGSYIENVHIVEVDFASNTITDVPDFVDIPVTEDQPKECSKEDCANCTSCDVKEAKSRTTKKQPKQKTKETKMAKAPKKAAAPKKSASPKKPAKKSASKSASKSK